LSVSCYRRRQYSRCKFIDTIEEAILRDRIDKLGSLVHRLTLENEFFRKEFQYNISQTVGNREWSPGTGISSVISPEAVSW
jgi:hypothetical protein